MSLYDELLSILPFLFLLCAIIEGFMCFTKFNISGETLYVKERGSSTVFGKDFNFSYD